MELGGGICVCRAGESFDLLALMIYGDERYAADLMNANPSMCRTMVFGGGEKLDVPILDIADDEMENGAPGAAPWKQ